MTKEENKEYCKNYYNTHKDLFAKKNENWRKTHKGYSHEYYENHKEQYKKSNQKWRDNHKKEWVKICANNRRKRIERLRAEGVLNPYYVTNHPEKEKKYAKVQD